MHEYCIYILYVGVKLSFSKTTYTAGEDFTTDYPELVLSEALNCSFVVFVNITDITTNGM